MVQKGKKYRKNSHLIIHFPTSEGVSGVREVNKQGERVSVEERASNASKVEQVNE